jgi:hypothetical protein
MVVYVHGFWWNRWFHLHAGSNTLPSFLCTFLYSIPASSSPLVSILLTIVNFQGGNDKKTNSLFGLGLTILSLTMDGATGAIQDRIVSLKITTHQMMFGINAMSIIWLSLVQIATGEGVEALEFTVRHPEIWKDLGTFCVVSAIGQNFIFLGRWKKTYPLL